MKVSLPSAEELRKKTGENRQGGVVAQGIANREAPLEGR